MLHEVQRDCVAGDYRLDIVLSTVSHDDYDNVSNCSDDIGPDDDFAWYSNSRDFLVIDTIPDPYPGDTLPPDYVEMPKDSVTGSTRPNPSSNSTTAPTTAPLPSRPSRRLPQRISTRRIRTLPSRFGNLNTAWTASATSHSSVHQYHPPHRATSRTCSRYI